jgi:hypothetical protein
VVLHEVIGVTALLVLTSWSADEAGMQALDAIISAPAKSPRQSGSRRADSNRGPLNDERRTVGNARARAGNFSLQTKLFFRSPTGRACPLIRAVMYPFCTRVEFRERRATGRSSTSLQPSEARLQSPRSAHGLDRGRRLQLVF